MSHDTRRYDRTIRLSPQSLADPPMRTLDSYNAQATADEVDKALSNHKVFSPLCLSTAMADVNQYLDRISNRAQHRSSFLATEMAAVDHSKGCSKV